MIAACLCLTPTLSRYTSTGNGVATGYVAKFDMNFEIPRFQSGQVYFDTEGQYFIENIQPGWAADYVVTVTNQSEVTVDYSFSANTFQNLPLTVQLIGGDMSGTLSINESATFTVRFHWPKSENSPKYAEEIDAITFILHCEQID